MANLNYHRGLVNPRTSTGGIPETTEYQVDAANAVPIFIGDVLKISADGNANHKVSFKNAAVANESSMTAVSLGYLASKTAGSVPVVRADPSITWEAVGVFASGSAGQTLVGQLCTVTSNAGVGRVAVLQSTAYVQALGNGTTGLVQIVGLGSRPDNETGSTDANPVVRVRFLPYTPL